MKTCLVLEGGAMRGMYTAGALDVFYNAGIQFDGIIGVSAGAAFGVNYLSPQPGPVIRYNKRFKADHNYMGLITQLKTGEALISFLDENGAPVRLYEEEADSARLEAEMAENACDAEKLNALYQEQQDVQKRLEQEMERWEELSLRAEEQEER